MQDAKSHAGFGGIAGQCAGLGTVQDEQSMRVLRTITLTDQAGGAVPTNPTESCPLCIDVMGN